MKNGAWIHKLFKLMPAPAASQNHVDRYHETTGFTLIFSNLPWPSYILCSLISVFRLFIHFIIVMSNPSRGLLLRKVLDQKKIWTFERGGMKIFLRLCTGKTWLSSNNRNKIVVFLLLTIARYEIYMISFDLTAEFAWKIIRKKWIKSHCTA